MIGISNFLFNQFFFETISKAKSTGRLTNTAKCEIDRYETYQVTSYLSISFGFENKNKTAIQKHTAVTSWLFMVLFTPSSPLCKERKTRKKISSIRHRRQ